MPTSVKNAEQSKTEGYIGKESTALTKSAEQSPLSTEQSKTSDTSPTNTTNNGASPRFRTAEIMPTPANNDYKCIEAGARAVGMSAFNLRERFGLCVDDMAFMFQLTGASDTIAPNISRLMNPPEDRPTKVDALLYMRKWGTDVEALLDGRTPNEAVVPRILPYKLCCTAIELMQDPEAIRILNEYRSTRTQSEYETVALNVQLENAISAIIAEDGYSLNEFAEGLARYSDRKDKTDNKAPGRTEYKAHRQCKETGKMITEVAVRDKKAIMTKSDRFQAMFRRFMKHPKKPANLPWMELVVIMRHIYKERFKVNALLDSVAVPVPDFPIALTEYLHGLNICISMC